MRVRRSPRVAQTTDSEVEETKQRVRRVRAAIEEQEPSAEDEEEGLEEAQAEDEGGSTEKEVLDRIEARYRDRATSPLRAIRAFCVLCMGCQPRMVAGCTAKNCVLYPFRFGKNPHQKHVKKSKV